MNAPHAQSIIALYTEPDAQCDQQLGNRRRLYTARPMHVYRKYHRRQVLSTPERPLSLFISHLLTVSASW